MALQKPEDIAITPIGPPDERYTSDHEPLAITPYAPEEKMHELPDTITDITPKGADNPKVDNKIAPPAKAKRKKEEAKDNEREGDEITYQRSDRSKKWIEKPAWIREDPSESSSSSSSSPSLSEAEEERESESVSEPESHKKDGKNMKNKKDKFAEKAKQKKKVGKKADKNKKEKVEPWREQIIYEIDQGYIRNRNIGEPVLAQCATKLKSKQEKFAKAIERTGIIRKEIMAAKRYVNNQAKKEIAAIQREAQREIAATQQTAQQETIVIEQEKRKAHAQIERKYKPEMLANSNHEQQIRKAVENYKAAVEQCMNFMKQLETNRKVMKQKARGQKATGTIRPLPPLPQIPKRSDRKRGKKKKEILEKKEEKRSDTASDSDKRNDDDRDHYDRRSHLHKPDHYDKPPVDLHKDKMTTSDLHRSKFARAQRISFEKAAQQPLDVQEINRAAVDGSIGWFGGGFYDQLKTSEQANRAGCLRLFKGGKGCGWTVDLQKPEAAPLVAKTKNFIAVLLETYTERVCIGCKKDKAERKVILVPDNEPVEIIFNAELGGVNSKRGFVAKQIRRVRGYFEYIPICEPCSRNQYMQSVFVKFIDNQYVWLSNGKRIKYTWK
eukprot:443798_1